MSKKLIACAGISAILTSNIFNVSSAIADSETNVNQTRGHQHSMPHYGHNTPDSHAPIGVMGDHWHDEGEIMLSYRNKRMLMKGMRSGDSDITPNAVVAAGGAFGYMMTPTRMTMDMHMIGAMYGVNNDLTLMAMGHYMDKNMNMVNRAGVRSKMDSQGFGDTTISAMYKIFEEKNFARNSGGNQNEEGRLHTSFGLSLPTGSTDEKGIRMGSYGNLPYAMQLGSGTFDPVLGLTYFKQEGEFSYGAQANAKIRTGKNDDGYRLGDEYSIQGWIAKKVTDWASLSLRLEGKTTGEIEGADQSTFGFRNMVTTADPENYGGEIINLGIGFNILTGEGALAGHRIGFEYETPIYQDLNGIQMETQHSFILGWQYSW